jgi:hypothetical protein
MYCGALSGHNTLLESNFSGDLVAEREREGRKALRVGETGSSSAVWIRMRCGERLGRK